MITLKSPAEIAAMHKAGDALDECIRRGFQFIETALSEGRKITKLDVERVMADTAENLGVESAFKGFDGYPYTSCISINEEIVHGLPSEAEIKDGDLVTLDFGTKYKGWCADSALTKLVGNYNKEDFKYQQLQHLIDTCYAALDAAIACCVVGKTLGDITKAIHSTASPSGYGIINAYTGHGIGKDMHEEPRVYNTYPVPPGYEETKLRKGLVICIEPMLSLSPIADTVKLDDKWTVVTSDGCHAIHVEEMVAIVGGAPLRLTHPRSK